MSSVTKDEFIYLVGLRKVSLCRNLLAIHESFPIDKYKQLCMSWTESGKGNLKYFVFGKFGSLSITHQNFMQIIFRLHLTPSDFFFVPLKIVDLLVALSRKIF